MSIKYYQKIKNSNTIFFLSKYGYSATSSGSIFLNFPKENSLTNGCKKQCNFCYWKNFNIKLCPTNSEIEEYLKYCWGNTISLSGGGDPLFDFDKNKKELERICDFLHSKNRKVELISTEWNTIESELDSFIKKNIDKFAFSAQKKDEKLLLLLKKISIHYPKENIRIIKIYNKNETIEELLNFYEFYSDYVSIFYLRENYYDRLEPKEIEYISNALLEKIGTRMIFSRTSSQIILINNCIFDVTFFNQLLKEKEKLIELLNKKK